MGWSDKGRPFRRHAWCRAMTDIRQVALEAERLDADEHCPGVTIVPIRKLHEWADEIERAGGKRRHAFRFRNGRQNSSGVARQVGDERHPRNGRQNSSGVARQVGDVRSISRST
jgi:hypothetical protein